MKVHWTDLAVKHLADIHEYIARTSRRFALRMVDRLTRRSQQIGIFPHSGRVVPGKNDQNLREVFEGPYRIVCRIKRTRSMWWPLSTGRGSGLPEKTLRAYSA